MISNSMFAQLFLYVPRQSPCCHQSKYLLKNWLYRSSFRSCRIAGICWGCFNRSLQQLGCLQKRFSFRVASMAPWAKIQSHPEVKTRGISGNLTSQIGLSPANVFVTFFTLHWHQEHPPPSHSYKRREFNRKCSFLPKDIVSENVAAVENIRLQL